MLKRLILHNFVIVRRVEIEFEQGFCVFTGETGAGKSLLVGALSLLAGARAAADMIYPGASAAEMQAAFDISDNAAARQYLADNALADDNSDDSDDDDDNDTILIRRVIGGKKSAAFINGRQVSLSQLASVTGLLIDIFGQHAHYLLREQREQQRLLDEYAGAGRAVSDVAAAHRDWRALCERYEQENARADAAEATRARLTEVLGELNALNFTDDNWREMNATLTRAANANDLTQAGIQAAEALAGAGGAQESISRARRLADDMAKRDASVAALLPIIDDADSLVNDAARELSAYVERLDADPNAGAAADQFVADCHRAARKYGVSDPARLGEYIAGVAAEMESLPTAQGLEQLREETAAARAALDKLCAALTKQRKKAGVALQREVNALLGQLAMARAELTVSFTPEETPTARGAEKTRLLIRTQPNRPPGAISEVASGGELSRLGLAIQLAATDARGGAVSVFDEVDAGIGGGAAGAVGRLLRRLGERRQVICITHLPQVAAAANAQWRVAGGDDIAQLDSAARIEEIARMHSGEKITDLARDHAAGLIEQYR